MRFLHLRLQDFRNITFAELDLAPARSFLLGPNGQGKSNLLEALGLVTALRSFRTQQTSALRRQGAQGYALVYTVEHETLGQTELEIRAGGQGHQVWLDGERVSRLGDFIGRFPVVPLSAGDLMLLRGAPSERRRFLDLTLSAMDGEYYQALRHYHRGIAGRNHLLKRGGSAAELSAFEAELAPQALQLSVKRKAGVARLQTHLSDAYTSIAEADEGPELQFKPNLESETVAALREVFEQSRTRDQAIGSTQRGPHRDDVAFVLHTGGAKEFASDGQQRGLCVALRIAQARMFEASLGIAPVLLADDVLGELDPRRKAGFWRASPSAWQMIATGTELPEASEAWSVWKVRNGAFELQ